MGGSGLPSGATGRRIAELGHPLHWEPLTAKATRSVRALEPAVVVIAAERIPSTTRALLSRLQDLKSDIDLVVFQLRSREPRTKAPGVDGVLIDGRGLVSQLKTVMATLSGSEAHKAAAARAQKRAKRMREEIDNLRRLAVRDDLTSLYNLRFFNSNLENEHQRASRFGRRYSLIFLDLDGLREVNARRGHLAGAQVLKRVGEFLRGRIRRIDLPARIGGDEFVIICPETDKRNARHAAERLRKGIARLENAQGEPLGITASMGVASFPDDGELPETVLQRADRALYEAKGQGKNRVCCWGEFQLPEDGEPYAASVHHDEIDLDTALGDKTAVN